MSASAACCVPRAFAKPQAYSERHANKRISSLTHDISSLTARTSTAALPATLSTIPPATSEAGRVKHGLQIAPAQGYSPMKGAKESDLGSWDQFQDSLSCNEARQQARQAPSLRSRSKGSGSSSNSSSSSLADTGRGYGTSNVRVETIMRLRPRLLNIAGTDRNSASQMSLDGRLPNLMILSSSSKRSARAGPPSQVPMYQETACPTSLSHHAHVALAHSFQDNIVSTRSPDILTTTPWLGAAPEATAEVTGLSGLSSHAASCLFVPVSPADLVSSQDACRALVQLASWVAPLPGSTDSSSSSSKDQAWVHSGFSSISTSSFNTSASFLQASDPEITASRDATLLHSLSLSFLLAQPPLMSNRTQPESAHAWRGSRATESGTDSHLISIHSSRSSRNRNDARLTTPAATPVLATSASVFDPAAATLTLWALGILCPQSARLASGTSRITVSGHEVDAHLSAQQLQVAAAVRLLMHHCADILEPLSSSSSASSSKACSTAELSRAVWGVAQCLEKGAVAQPTPEADRIKAGLVSSSAFLKAAGSGCSIKDKHTRRTSVRSTAAHGLALNKPLTGLSKHSSSSRSSSSSSTSQGSTVSHDSSTTQPPTMQGSSEKLRPTSASSRQREGSRAFSALSPTSPSSQPLLTICHPASAMTPTTPPSSEPRSQDKWVSWLSGMYDSSACLLHSACSCAPSTTTSSSGSSSSSKGESISRVINSPGCCCNYATACSCDCVHRSQHIADLLSSAVQLGFKPPDTWVSSLWLSLDRITLAPSQQQFTQQPHQIHEPSQLQPAVQHTTLTQILTSIADLGLQLRPTPAGTQPNTLKAQKAQPEPAPKPDTNTQVVSTIKPVNAAVEHLVATPTPASPLPPATLLPKLLALSQHLLPTCTPATLASTLAAFPRLQLHPSGSWVAAWSARSLQTMEQASAQQVSSCLVSFAALKLAPARLWADSAMTRIMQLSQHGPDYAQQQGSCGCGCGGGVSCSGSGSIHSSSSSSSSSGVVGMFDLQSDSITGAVFGEGSGLQGGSRDWSNLKAADWASLLHALASLDVRVEPEWLWKAAALLTPQVPSMPVGTLSTCLHSIARLHTSRSHSGPSVDSTPNSSQRTLPAFLTACASASLPILRSSSKEHALNIGWSLCVLAKPAAEMQAAVAAEAENSRGDSSPDESAQLSELQPPGSDSAQAAAASSTCLPDNQWRSRYYQVMQQHCSSLRGAEVVTALECAAMLQPAWEERSSLISSNPDVPAAPVQSSAASKPRRLLFSGQSQGTAHMVVANLGPLHQHAPGPLPPPMLLHTRLLEQVLLPEAVCSADNVAHALHHAATQLHSGVSARWLQAALTALHASRGTASGSALARGVLAAASVAEPRRAAHRLRPPRPLIGAIARQCGRRSLSLPAEQLANLATALISLDTLQQEALLLAALKRQHRRHLARLARATQPSIGAPAMQRWRQHLPIRIASPLFKHADPSATLLPPSPLEPLESQLAEAHSSNSQQPEIQAPIAAELLHSKVAPVLAVLWPLLPLSTPQPSLLTQRPVRVRPYLPQRFRFLPVDYVTAFSSSTILRQATAAASAAAAAAASSHQAGTPEQVQIGGHAVSDSAGQLEVKALHHKEGDLSSGVSSSSSVADVGPAVASRSNSSGSSSVAAGSVTSIPESSSHSSDRFSNSSISSTSSMRTLEKINGLACLTRKPSITSSTHTIPKRSTGLLQQWMKELQSDIASGSGSIQSLCAIAQALVTTGITVSPSSLPPSSAHTRPQRSSTPSLLPASWHSAATSMIAPSAASVSIASIFLRGIAPLATHTLASPLTRQVTPRHRMSTQHRRHIRSPTFASLAISRSPPLSLLQPPASWRATLLRASLPKLAHMASSAIGMSWLLQSVACPALTQLEPTWLPIWHNHTWARLHRLPASHLSALLQLHLTHSWTPPFRWMDSAAQAIAALACPSLASSLSAQPQARPSISPSAGSSASARSVASKGNLAQDQQVQFPVVVSLTCDLHALGFPPNAELLAAIGSSFSLSLTSASALQTLQILHSLQTLQPQPQVYTSAELAGGSVTSEGRSAVTGKAETATWIPELMSALHGHITARSPARFVQQLQQEQRNEMAAYNTAATAFEQQQALRRAAARNEIGRDGFRRRDVSNISRHQMYAFQTRLNTPSTTSQRSASPPVLPDHTQLLPCLLASFVRWCHAPSAPWVAEVLRHASGLTQGDTVSRSRMSDDFSSSNSSPPASLSGSQLVSMLYSALQLDHTPALDTTASLLDAIYEQMADTPPSHLVILVSCLGKFQRRPADAWWDRLEEVLDPGHNPDITSASSAFPIMSVDDVDDWSGVASLSVRELSQVLSAMVTLGRVPKASWLSGVLILVARGLADADGAVVASVLRSLAALREYPGKLYMERLLSVSQAYMECSEAGELADLIHALATLKHKPRAEWVSAFLARFGEVFTDCWPSQLHTTLVALATLDVRPPSTLLDSLLRSLLLPHVLQATGAPQALELAWAVERLIGSSSGPFVLPSMQEIIGGSGGANAALLGAMKAGALVAGVNKPPSASSRKAGATVRVVGSRRGKAMSAGSSRSATAQPRYTTRSSAKQSMLISQLMGSNVEDEEADEVRLPRLDLSHVGQKLAEVVAAELRRHCSRSIIGPLVTTERRPLHRHELHHTDTSAGVPGRLEFEEQMLPLLAARMRKPLKPLPHMQMSSRSRGPSGSSGQGGAHVRIEQDDSRREAVASRRNRMFEIEPVSTAASSGRW